MVRVEIQLLPEEGNDRQEIQKANAEAHHGGEHLRVLVGNRKCSRHPSANNKLRVIAVKGGDPKLEVISMCCIRYYKQLK